MLLSKNSVLVKKKNLYVYHCIALIPMTDGNKHLVTKSKKKYPYDHYHQKFDTNTFFKYFLICWQLLCYYPALQIITHTYISWLTLVKDNPKVPFSLPMSRCKGEHYSFHCIAPLTFNLYLIILSDKQGGIKYHFLKSFVWLNLGLNTQIIMLIWTYMCTSRSI